MVILPFKFTHLCRMLIITIYLTLQDCESFFQIYPNSASPGQTQQNEASDQGPHCLPIGICMQSNKQK